MSIDWDIHTYNSVASTQDHAREMADDGAYEGTVVHALMQHSGRGRHGRSWQSVEGNLSLSLVLRPNCSAQNIGQLALIAGIAVVEGIHEFAKTLELRDQSSAQLDDFIIKWPNDVLWRGRKCAGLLLETAISANGMLDYVIVGLGVNVAASPLDGGVALSEILCREDDDVSLDVSVLQNCFLNALDAYYQHWLAEGFNDIRQRWLSLAHIPGTAMSVKVGTQLEKGVFHDIDGAGNLRMKQSDEGMEDVIRLITAGDVYCEGSA